jgi:quinol-cytochrome oxidoreductase complex cytochrome b subunit
MPFLITATVLLHLSFLHLSGSTTPLSTDLITDDLTFYPYFYLKDLFSLLMFFSVFLTFIFFYPNYFRHPDNYILANPLITPTHLVPEWYFLPFYAVLRATPSKLRRLIMIFLTILLFFFLPVKDVNTLDNNFLIGRTAQNLIFRETNFSDLNEFEDTVIPTILLRYYRAKPVETPYTEIAQFLTIAFFSDIFVKFIK